jgi:hypothetical protein
MRKFPQVRTIVGAVLAALAGCAALADESTTVSGKGFIDLTNYDLRNDGVDSATNGFGLDVKRFYLGVTHNFDDTWSANITTDFNYVGNDNETQLFVKKAYLQAKLSDAFVARAGSADLPWVPFVEDLYGYRFVENVMVDRLKFGTSADWGVHVGGKVAEGRFSYAASVINGAGYKNPTRSNSVDFEGRLAFQPVKGFTIAVGGYSGKLGKDIEGSPTPTQHTAEREDALVAYVNNGLRLGGEYFQATDWNQVIAPVKDKADGFSVWGSYDFTAKWGVFARYDDAKPGKDLLPDLEDKYFNVGVVAHPRKNIDVAFVYKNEKVDGGGTVATSNGTIGGVLDEGKYDEVGVWAQVAF